MHTTKACAKWPNVKPPFVDTCTYVRWVRDDDDDELLLCRGRGSELDMLCRRCSLWIWSSSKVKVVLLLSPSVGESSWGADVEEDISDSVRMRLIWGAFLLLLWSGNNEPVPDSDALYCWRAVLCRGALVTDVGGVVVRGKTSALLLLVNASMTCVWLDEPPFPTR